jgi:hypothetical protein
VRRSLVKPNTTQDYVAIYDQDGIDHHRCFIAHRRSLRPGEKYRKSTAAEWDEFLAHFGKRKVELGVCGRAYGPPGIHEHACLRCPLLRPDPKQSARLIEIQDNLKARLIEAKKGGWLGDVEGLNITLSGAAQKLAPMDSIEQSTRGDVVGPRQPRVHVSTPSRSEAPGASGQHRSP